MPIFFEIVKVIFFLLSVLMSVFFLRGYYFLPEQTFLSWSNILMPGYLMFVGLMVGYAAVLFHKTKINAPLTQQHRTRAFIGGLLVGVIFSLFYIFVR